MSEINQIFAFIFISSSFKLEPGNNIQMVIPIITTIQVWRYQIQVTNIHTQVMIQMMDLKEVVHDAFLDYYTPLVSCFYLDP